MLRSVLRDTALTVPALVLVGLTRIVFNTLVGRVFGLNVLGGANVGISMVFLATDIFVAGLAPTLGKFIPEFLGQGNMALARRVYGIIKFVVISISALFMAVMYLCRHQWAPNIQIGQTEYVSSLPLVFLYSMYVLEKSAYFGFGKVTEYARNEVISNILFFISLGGIVVCKNERLVLMPFYVMYLVFGLLSQIDLRHRGRILSENQVVIPVRRMIPFALFAIVGMAASMGRSQVSTIVVSSNLDVFSAGLYSSVFSLLTPLYLLPRALSLVIFPTMSRAYGAGDEKSNSLLLNQSTAWLTVGMGFICGLSILLAPSLLLFVLGSGEYMAMITAFRLLVISAYVSITTIPIVNALSSTRYVHIPNIAAVVALLANIVVWQWLLPDSGINGVALGYLVGTVLNAAIPIFYGIRNFKFQLGGYLKSVISLAIVLCIVLIMQDLINTTWSYILSISLFVVLLCFQAIAQKLTL